MRKRLLIYDDGRTPAIHADDGRTPAIHAVEVEAETMADALTASGLPPRNVWACALANDVGAAALSLCAHSTVDESKRA